MSKTPRSILRLATSGFHLASRTKPQDHPMAGKLGAAGGLTLTSRACPLRMNNRRSTSSIAGTCERGKRERLQRRTPKKRIKGKDVGVADTGLKVAVEGRNSVWALARGTSGQPGKNQKRRRRMKRMRKRMKKMAQATQL